MSRADRGKGEAAVLGTPPHRAKHLRRAASQQQSWFGGYSQPHPRSCRRALRLMALSPSHTLSRRAGGGGVFPLTQQFTQALSTPNVQTPQKV